MVYSSLPTTAMPELQAKQLPALAAALIRLRGETLVSIAEATQIRSANLSVWLRGREQVISDKRVSTLLHHLGVEGGKLRSDVLHSWHDTGALTDVQTVSAALVTAETENWLFQDREPGRLKTRFLLVGEAWVRVELELGATVAKDLAEVVQVLRVITVDGRLEGVGTCSLQGTKDVVLQMAKLAALRDGDGHLLDHLTFRLDPAPEAGSELPPGASQGWWRLTDALRNALALGLTPDEIAKVIEAASEAAAKNMDRYGNPL